MRRRTGKERFEDWKDVGAGLLAGYDFDGDIIIKRLTPDLLWMMQNLSAVEEWFMKLSPEDQWEMSHPTQIRKYFAK